MPLSKKQIDTVVQKQLLSLQALKKRAAQNDVELTLPVAKELAAKASGGTPYIYMYTEAGTAYPGQEVIAYLNITNPSDADYGSQDWDNPNLYVTVFTGPAQFIPDVAQALAARDNRFPFFSTGPLYVGPASSATSTLIVRLPNHSSDVAVEVEPAWDLVHKEVIFFNYILWALPKNSSQPRQPAVVFDRAAMSITLRPKADG